jgi:hypothetical protein
MVRLSKALYLTSPIVSVVASAVLVAGVFAMRNGDWSDGTPYFAVAALGAMYAGILGLVFCYKMWESIQDGHARTSPGKAVGFLFIPIFSFYWIFQVIWGFAKDYNAYVDRYAINTKKLPEGLFLACAILPLTSWIPFLGIATGLAYLVVFVIVMSRVCDAVNALPPRGDTSLPGGAAAIDNAPPQVGASQPAIRPGEPSAGQVSLFCVSGEFAHHTIAIPASGLSIGRDPARVNLVFASTTISGVHARVMPEPSGQLWVEDLNSVNGTFYRQPGLRGQDAGLAWVPLQGRILLPAGGQFRLAADGPEFEIRK